MFFWSRNPVSQKSPNGLTFLCRQTVRTTGHQTIITSHVAHLILCLVKSSRTHNSLLQLFNKVAIQHLWEYKVLKKMVLHVGEYNSSARISNNGGARFHGRLQIGWLCWETLCTVSHENTLSLNPTYILRLDRHPQLHLFSESGFFPHNQVELKCWS